MATNRQNEYLKAIPAKTYARTPKSVLAAIAISALTSGGDFLPQAENRLLREWAILWENGIVPQKPFRLVSTSIDDSQEFTE